MRTLRLHEYEFSGNTIYIFVPSPGLRGAPEAFISARYKQRVFKSAGFRCIVCRADEKEADRGRQAVKIGRAYYVIQRPLERLSFLGESLERSDLDYGTGRLWRWSALTDTVLRIVLPFVKRRMSHYPFDPVRIGILGNKGFFGSEIESALGFEHVRTVGIDLHDDLSAIANTHILISATGSPGVILGSQIGIHKDILIDVGYTYDEKLGRGFGDLTFSSYSRCDFYTPVPGGVGPLQALTLVERALSLCNYNSFKPWALTISDFV